MKCPKCTPIPGNYIQAACPHCRHTGEIQEGDWWMCEWMGSKHKSPMEFAGGAWWEYDQHLDIFTAYCCQDDVLPLHRMEAVK